MFFVAFSPSSYLDCQRGQFFASWYCCWGGGAVRGFYYYDYDIPLQYFDRPGKAYHPGDLYLPNLPYLTLLEGPMIVDIGLPITRNH